MDEIDQLPISELVWDDAGLAPAVVQDGSTDRVLMLAFMNAEALERTFRTGQVWFWSRSRRELWHKGATSGNTLDLEGIYVNCENNSLLVQVRPAGPACHTGHESCFYRRLESRKGE